MVCLDTPSSRPTSAALRPASICFSAPIISTSLYFLLDMPPPLRKMRKSYTLLRGFWGAGHTPVLKYGYDAVAPSGCTLPSLTINNGIGKRTGMCDAAGAEAWSWDITAGVGWKITDARTTNGLTKNSIDQNNLDGS